MLLVVLVFFCLYFNILNKLGIFGNMTLCVFCPNSYMSLLIKSLKFTSTCVTFVCKASVACTTEAWFLMQTVHFKTIPQSLCRYCAPQLRTYPQFCGHRLTVKLFSGKQNLRWKVIASNYQVLVKKNNKIMV